jgi:hypothetical protein
MLVPGANVVKLICPQYTDFRNKLVFVLGRPFQPSVMFVNKARVYLNEALFRCSTIG